MLSQLASENVLVQASVPFSVGLFRTNFQVPNFLFSGLYGSMEEENIMYQQLQKICRENVCRIKVFRVNLGKYGRNILFTPKQLPTPTPVCKYI